MAAFARNADFSQILAMIAQESITCKGFYPPGNITVSSGTNVNHWNDSSGNANHYDVGGGTPQKSTLNGQASILCDGIGDYLIPTGARNWSNFLSGNKHWIMRVWKSLAAGGTRTAAFFYNSKGPGPSDTAQYINVGQFLSTSGIDSDGCEVWVNGGLSKDADPTTTDPGSTTRNTELYETWIDSGNVLTAKASNGRGTRVATVSGCTGYGLKTGIPVIGKTGAGAPYLNCHLSFMMICETAPSVKAQAFACKVLGRIYGVDW